MKYKKEYQQHVAMNPVYHCTYNGFLSRITKSKYFETIEKAIHDPRRGKTEDWYAIHLELHGDNAVTFDSFRSRLKVGRDHEKAINTPRGKRGPKRRKNTLK